MIGREKDVAARHDRGSCRPERKETSLKRLGRQGLAGLLIALTALEKLDCTTAAGDHVCALFFPSSSSSSPVPRCGTALRCPPSPPFPT